MARRLPWIVCLVLSSTLQAGAQSEAKKPTGPLKALKYRAIGPAAGGRVSRACGVPGDPSTYYLAAASGGVWKSTDGGLAWKSIFDEQRESSLGAIAVAPSDPNVVYVGGGEANIRGNVVPGAGIFLSVDGGKNWQHVWKQRGQIGKIIVHPSDADTAYAAVLGHAFGPNPQRGVYRTRDGGKTWQKVLSGEVKISRNGGDVKEAVGAIDVCFDPNNPRVLFAALWQVRRTPWSLTAGGPGSGLYYSEDAGDTWKKLGPQGTDARDDEDNGLPPGPYGRIGIAVAPSDSQRVYALIEADKGGLYRSDDGGTKWNLVNSAHYLRTRPWYFSTVTVDPGNADVVWCPNVRLLRSIDAGKTFKNVKGPHHVDHHDLWIDPRNPLRMIDSNDGGVDISNNGGGSWLAPMLPLCQFYHIAVDTRTPYHVSGTMQDLGTASGPSNSLTSDGISLCDWISVGGGETGYTAPDPTDPNIVYAGEYGGYVSRFDLRTRQAQNVSIYPITPSGKGAAELRYRFQWTAPLLISPHDPKTIYHAANVLFRSTDAGKSWTPISPDLTRDDKSKQQWTGGPITGDNTGVEYYCTLFAIAESPLEAGLLWVGSDDGLVHLSRDAGKTWLNVSKNIAGFPEWGTVACIEPSRHDKGTAYLVVDAHRLDDNRPYLWVTRDYGKSWQNLAGGLPQDEYLMVVREDPVAKDLLFVGALHGVHYSRNGGQLWKSLRLNMPTVAVTDLAIKNKDLVVGTNGRSLWIFDDLTPVRQEAKAGDLTLFEVQPAHRWRYGSASYGAVDKNPGDNPPKGAILHYALPKEPKGDLLLEIFDEQGGLVHKFTSKKTEPEEDEDDPEGSSDFKPVVLPKDAGIQRIAWDLSYAPPTTIPKAKSDFGVPKYGPLAPPGEYIIKLTVDGKVATSRVKVLPDPRVKMSPEEVIAQVRFSLTIGEDISKLAKTVISLRSLKKQLNQRLETWTEIPRTGPLQKSAKELIEKLDALDARLHNPKAEVTYDILAQKGGARLYSQLNLLFDWSKDVDGPITQGMRETYAEHHKELTALLAEWATLRQAMDAINTRSFELKIPQLVAP